MFMFWGLQHKEIAGDAVSSFGARVDSPDCNMYIFTLQTVSRTYLPYFSVSSSLDTDIAHLNHRLTKLGVEVQSTRAPERQELLQKRPRGGFRPELLIGVKDPATVSEVCEERTVEAVGASCIEGDPPGAVSPWGQSDWSWERKDGMIDGLALLAVVFVKLYSL
ncbi:hypothetical protein CDL15_Pgr025706 [Punica granatum]|uniref:Uncharacterized protein n=1 Tax=Punica granatum TaxID=22663 RepID=A0A218WAF6_PUNGR|nr:hypothetical protein CDL15_Pgr025706 [Punica granatum]